MSGNLPPKVFDRLEFDCRTPCEEQDEKPPPSKALVDFGTGDISSSCALAGRLANFWQLLGDRSVPFIRSPLFIGRRIILKDIQK